MGIHILSKNSGAYGHTCCGHSILSHFSERPVSWLHPSRFHDIKNLKAMYSKSKHGVIGMGPDCKGQKSNIEKLWRDFFSDPSQWLDNRCEKVNVRYPDFKHKTTQEGLWLDGKSNPPWVEVELAAMTPGTVQVDSFSWNRKLAQFVKAGQYVEVIELLQKMQEEGISLNSYSFVPALSACSSLGATQYGRDIHAKIIRSGCESDVYVGTCLVDMYCKCGSIEDACQVFNKMPIRNVVAWGAMIQGHVKCGQCQKALELFQQMQQEGVEPDSLTFIGVLNACAGLRSLDEGRRVHEQIMLRGYECVVFVNNCLVDMYAKCGSIEDAWHVFNKMPKHDVVGWTAMIFGFVKCGQGQRALELSWQMQREGVEPSPVTLLGLLNACANEVALEEGRRIHAQIIQNGYDTDIFMASGLVDMYAKCGSIEDAQRVFDRTSQRDLVAWTAMIQGYVKCGQGGKALELFQQMQQEGVEPDPVTFMGLLNACATMVALDEGRRLHEQIIQRGFESDIYVGCGLIDMYIKCGSIADAWSVFNRLPAPDAVVWNAMILGCVKCGHELKALKVYQQMQRAGVEPSSGTFVAVLNTCASLVALTEGRQIHADIIKRGGEFVVSVGNCLVDMYSKCGSIEDAQKVFNEMPERNGISWSTMLGGYAMHGLGKEALGHFELMCQEGVEINGITFVSLLSACSHAGYLDDGLHYFESMFTGFSISTSVEHYTCMVDLLGRAGYLLEAEDLIKSLPFEPNEIMWTSLLGSCRVHGNVNMGEHIVSEVLKSDAGNASGYVLFSNIYATSGMLESSANMRQGQKAKCT